MVILKICSNINLQKKFFLKILLYEMKKLESKDCLCDEISSDLKINIKLILKKSPFMDFALSDLFFHICQDLRLSPFLL